MSDKPGTLPEIIEETEIGGIRLATDKTGVLLIGDQGKEYVLDSCDFIELALFLINKGGHDEQ